MTSTYMNFWFSSEQAQCCTNQGPTSLASITLRMPAITASALSTSCSEEELQWHPSKTSMDLLRRFAPRCCSQAREQPGVPVGLQVHMGPQA